MSDDGEVIEMESSVAVRGSDALTAFGDDVGLERARSIANQLSQLISERGLSVRIGKGEHLRVEAWCAAGAMVGLTPRTAWSKEARSPDGTILEGYEARVEVVRLSNGDVIGAAEAGCYFDETAGGHTRWTERHAAKSMAQTRAASKALGQVLRWIPVLAGYEGTPAEEMPHESHEMPQERRSAPSTPNRPAPPQKAAQSASGDAWLDEVFGTGKKVLRNGVSVRELSFRQIVEGASVGGERHDYLRFISEWLGGRINERSAAKFKGPNTEQKRRVDACIAMIEQQAAKDAQDATAEPEPELSDADIPF